MGMSETFNRGYDSFEAKFTGGWDLSDDKELIKGVYKHWLMDLIEAKHHLQSLWKFNDHVWACESVDDNLYIAEGFDKLAEVLEVDVEVTKSYGFEKKHFDYHGWTIYSLRKLTKAEML